MGIRSMRSICLLMSLPALLAGCGSMQIWPFGEEDTQERPGQPPNSTEYQCEGGKKFYVRMLDKGNTAWLILPLREVALAKVESASGERYSNGISTLQLKADGAILEEGPDNTYKGCKIPGKQVESKPADGKPAGEKPAEK